MYFLTLRNVGISQSSMSSGMTLIFRVFISSQNSASHSALTHSEATEFGESSTKI